MASPLGGMARGGRALIIGAALTVLWLVMLLIFWLTSGGDGAAGAPGWISVVAALSGKKATQGALEQPTHEP